MHSYIPHFGEKNILHSFIFVLLFFLLRYISHTIKFTQNLLYSQLCNHHHFLMSEHFHHAKKKHISFSSLSSFSTLLSLWEPLILFFVPVDSFRWNHTLHCSNPTFSKWSNLTGVCNIRDLTARFKTLIFPCFWLFVLCHFFRYNLEICLQPSASSEQVPENFLLSLCELGVYDLGYLTS